MHGTWLTYLLFLYTATPWKIATPHGKMNAAALTAALFSFACPFQLKNGCHRGVMSTLYNKDSLKKWTNFNSEVNYWTIYCTTIKKDRIEEWNLWVTCFYLRTFVRQSVSCLSMCRLTINKLIKHSETVLLWSILQSSHLHAHVLCGYEPWNGE